MQVNRHFPSTGAVVESITLTNTSISPVSVKVALGTLHVDVCLSAAGSSYSASNLQVGLITDVSVQATGDVEVAIHRRPVRPDPPIPTMTNFDHTIEPDMDARLRAGERGQHSAQEFWGEVWFAEGVFYERVMRYHAEIDVVTACSLDELMESVNGRYGIE